MIRIGNASGFYGDRLSAPKEMLDGGPIDFLTGGELCQNNHHKYPMSPNFAARWFEIDTTYQVMKVFHFLGIIDMKGAQKMRYKAKPEAARAA